MFSKNNATHSNKGETVLDCFMGSGSTKQAAINLNRDFNGFELDNTYFNKASYALHKDTIKINDVVSLETSVDFGVPLL